MTPPGDSFTEAEGLADIGAAAPALASAIDSRHQLLVHKESIRSKVDQLAITLGTRNRLDHRGSSPTGTRGIGHACPESSRRKQYKRQIEGSDNKRDLLRAGLSSHDPYPFLKREAAALRAQTRESVLHPAHRAFSYGLGHTFITTNRWHSLHERLPSGDRK